jgi:hypothetical protein
MTPLSVDLESASGVRLVAAVGEEAALCAIEDPAVFLVKDVNSEGPRKDQAITE